MKMPIPAYMWIYDDGGAAIKGSVDVNGREGSIEILGFNHGLNIPVDIPTALLLSVVAAVCACGASGVAGGSLLLIPLACNMFGISNSEKTQAPAGLGEGSPKVG